MGALTERLAAQREGREPRPQEPVRIVPPQPVDRRPEWLRRSTFRRDLTGVAW